MSACTVNRARFAAALRLVATETRKTEVVIINRAARDVAFRAASFTEKATISKINAALKGKVLIGLAVQSLNINPGKSRWGRADLKKRMAEILRKRKRGIGALRAGWIKSIQALGGTYRGAKLTSGSASHGGATKATISSLVAKIWNSVQTKDVHKHTQSVEHIRVATSALERAIEFVANDREDYVRKKLIEKVLKDNSDK